jgi:uncharacterized protein YecE (DUF72 family)
VHVVDPFVSRPVTEGFTYFRLHGITGNRHVYSDAELAELAGMLQAEVPCYVMFNKMPRNEDAARFQALLAATRPT